MLGGEHTTRTPRISRGDEADEAETIRAGSRKDHRHPPAAPCSPRMRSAIEAIMAPRGRFTPFKGNGRRPRKRVDPFMPSNPVG